MVPKCAMTSREYLSSAAYIPKAEISKKNPSHAKDLLTLKCSSCLSQDNLSSHKVILRSCHVHDHTSLPVIPPVHYRTYVLSHKRSPRLCEFPFDGPQSVMKGFTLQTKSEYSWNRYTINGASVHTIK
jgi:hypothetical protein